MNYKEVLTVIGIIIGFISYAFYFHTIFHKGIKPHIFSWLVWSIVNSTAFFAQLAKAGGIGAWITGANAALCIAVMVVSFWKGDKNIAKSDWVILFFSLSAIVGWLTTNNPLTAIILVSLTDCLAVSLTFRKSYRNPFEESAGAFGIDLIKFFLELFALQSFNLTTALFPIVILINDSALVAMILVRKKLLNKQVSSFN